MTSGKEISRQGEDHDLSYLWWRTGDSRYGLACKAAQSRIVIIKALAVLQCGNCGEYVIEDSVMERVDAILARVDTAVELEILSYVA